MNHRPDRSVLHSLALMLTVALAGSGLGPAGAVAQAIEDDSPGLTHLPVYRSVAAFPAWEDRSDELPGISSGSTILIAAGVLAVGAIVYYAVRSDDDDDESGEDEGTETSRNRIVPNVLVDVGDAGAGVAAPRWRVGLNWVF